MVIEFLVNFLILGCLGVIFIGPLVLLVCFIANIVAIIGEKIRGNKIEDWLKVTTLIYPIIAGSLICMLLFVVSRIQSSVSSM